MNEECSKRRLRLPVFLTVNCDKNIMTMMIIIIIVTVKIIIIIIIDK